MIAKNKPELMSEPTCMIITTHFLPLIGGAQSVYDALARNLADQVSVLTAYTDYTTERSVDRWQEFDKSCPYPIARLKEVRLPMQSNDARSIFSKAISLYKEHNLRAKVLNTIERQEKTNPVDIYCIGALDALGWLVQDIQVRFQKKTMLYIHGEEVSQKPYNDRAYARRIKAIEAVDHIVAVSDFTKQCLVKAYGVAPEKVSVLTNGVDFNRFASASHPISNDREIKTYDLTILSVGRLVERKGFDRLIQAFSRIDLKNHNVQLRIIGEGPYKKHLQQLVSDYNLEGRVIFGGAVNDGELVAEYKNADIFAMPNRTLADGDTEGLGLVFLEAAASKTALLGGNAGGVPSVITNDETGLLVDGRDVDEIYQKLMILIENSSLRSRLAQNAYEYAKSQDWRLKAIEFQTILKNI
ncbi:glycosyltransferase family 4 protein [Kordiimonas sp. SCSIO 12610]|uniref:glycosyltransferase family 4 protein n=1 Tax=Kordiimonas sp. SCSIO 12610 TaxID=2829597 RepID=UPI00210CA847|nr:glycosyltransferase family 4 protein [Kordiimonas sp. SCSIO 12610]UTW56715.1 glycosyltransferase family 4 protein [Kordiimonas sp. SCSIO 12610]